MKFLLILAGAFLLPAEPVHSLLPEPGLFKMSNGLLLHWNVNAKDRSRDSVEAFDMAGVRVLGLNIYKLLPSAETISIDDIAVRRNESIAMVAEIRENDNHIHAWLLQLGWDTRLARATQLEDATSIAWLDFDESANIWGLADYQGEKSRRYSVCNGVPCPPGPLILVFNPEGKIVKSILKQVDFPDGLREAPAIGQVTFGLTNDRVWFWQPATHHMIVMDREGGHIRKISIPHARTCNLGGLTLLTPGGDVVQDLHSPTPGVRGLYLSNARHSERINPPQNASLAGMDGSEFVFLRRDNATDDFLIIRIKSLAELQKLRQVAYPAP
jgi:hypothetical protein